MELSLLFLSIQKKIQQFIEIVMTDKYRRYSLCMIWYDDDNV